MEYELLPLIAICAFVFALVFFSVFDFFVKERN